MYIRSAFAAMAGSAALLMSAPVFAQSNDDEYDGTLVLLDNSAWGGSELGGPFEVHQEPTPAHPGLGMFGADEGNFITFCMERDELIDPGIEYDVRLNDRTIGDDNDIDPLDERTAYLYTLFSTGTLDEEFNAWAGSTYDFEYLDAESGEVLQDAIWEIEDEDGFVYANEEFTDELIAFADEAVSEGGEWFGRGIGAVRVLNVYLDEENRQDVLTFVPLPIPAAMAFVGLAGMGAIGGLRRRRLA